MTSRTTSRLAAVPRRLPPEGPFDLVVVGGGINGAGVVRDAVLRGLTVCLLEKGDIASGTSSKTSKMLHGGMRYLEQLQLGLVFESLRERSLQLRLAPHLAAPRPFVIPVYRDSRRGVRWIRAGILLCDLLALGRRLEKGRFLPADEVAERVPGILEDSLIGGGLYHDGVMDDARLCLANVLDARVAARKGQLYVRSHSEVRSIRATSPLQVDVEDHILGTPFRVLANRVVRVVGPWTDQDRDGPPLLIPSKGVHLVLPPLEYSGYGPHGLLLSHSGDGRVFFVIPWRGKTLVGTTDDPFEGSPDDVRVEPHEAEYLLAELRRVFPGRDFASRDILATFAGIRPLVRAGAWRRATGKVSRKERIIDSGHGILTVTGGKYTTYRSVAGAVVDRIAPGTATSTHRRPLHGGECGGWEKYRSVEGQPWIERHGEATVRRLFHRHGAGLADVLALAEEDPELAEPIASPYPEIRAEVVHGVLGEELHYPADFICRRTDMRFCAGNGRRAYDEVERLICEYGAPLRCVPPDLHRAREAFLEELEWEDRLRRGESEIQERERESAVRPEEI